MYATFWFRWRHFIACLCINYFKKYLFCWLKLPSPLRKYFWILLVHPSPPPPTPFLFFFFFFSFFFFFLCSCCWNLFRFFCMIYVVKSHLQSKVLGLILSRKTDVLYHTQLRTHHEHSALRNASCPSKYRIPYFVKTIRSITELFPHSWYDLHTWHIRKQTDHPQRSS